MRDMKGVSPILDSRVEMKRELWRSSSCDWAMTSVVSSWPANSSCLSGDVEARFASSSSSPADISSSRNLLIRSSNRCSFFMSYLLSYLEFDTFFKLTSNAHKDLSYVCGGHFQLLGKCRSGKPVAISTFYDAATSWRELIDAMADGFDGEGFVALL